MSNAMKRGYILLAITNRQLPDPTAYHKQAANLAISLRANDPDNGKIGTKYPIALLTDDPNALNPPYKALFDTIITLDEAECIPFYSKTLLSLHTPFQETIYIDTDSLAIGDPDKLFDDLNGSEWASCIVTRAQYATQKRVRMSWVGEIKELYEYYDIQPQTIFSELNSSLIYWEKKSKLAKDIFRLAEHYYACDFFPDFKGLSPKGTEARGHFPDELAFETALLVTRHEPPNLDPFYMNFTRGGEKGYFGWTSQNSRYPLFTMPGGRGHSAGTLWKAYDTLREHFAGLLKKQTGINYGRGFKMDDRNKAANKAKPKRWDGLRPRKTPAAITRIINKYK